MMMVGLYARVSTKDKEQNPENQLIRLREYCKSRGWEYREYVDFASGVKKERPALNKIFTELEELDGVLTLRIDRFGRSAMQLAMNVMKLKDQGKFFEAIDQGIRINPGEKDPQTQFLLTILSAVAELERDMISDRVSDGIERARKQGKKLGRPTVLEGRKISAEDILKLRNSGKTIREISQYIGIKKSSVYNYLNSVQKR
ncbi:MAG: recombinase family protein [Thermoplasmataceae archaeon]